MSFRGAIFDVDGVLVDSPHEQAWREGLQQLMDNEWGDVRDQTSYAPEKFTPEVYQRVMSGKPRYAGVLGGASTQGAGPGIRRPQAGDDRRAHRGRQVPRLPRRSTLRPRDQRWW